MSRLRLSNVQGRKGPRTPNCSKLLKSGIKKHVKAAPVLSFSTAKEPVSPTYLGPSGLWVAFR